VAKLPIKGVAQRKLEEALEKLKEEGKLKKKKKKNGNDRTDAPKSNKT
jgi:hypothetical protein